MRFEIPIYDREQAHLLTCDIGSNVRFHEFDAFIQDLLYYNLIGPPEQLDVVTMVSHSGTVLLEPGQMNILQDVVDQFNLPCRICGYGFDLQFRTLLKEQNGLCSFHYSKELKDSIDI